MLLDDVKTGDLAILSDGSQALINSVCEADPQKFIVEFDTKVTGWVNREERYCWCYNRDGSFSTLAGDKNNPHIDIVKVVHND